MRYLGSILLPILLLSAGCIGGGGTSDASPSQPVETSAAAPTISEGPPTEFVPRFHTHDYWASRESVLLFGPHKIAIGQDALAETTFTSDSVIIGTTTFDTKTDGEQVNLADKTDVVFQGTERIEVKAVWSDTNSIPGLNFYYKPANTPTFTLLGPLRSGEPVNIYLKQGWADMPHQLSLSRWKFKLEAFNPQTASFPYKAYMSRGDVEVEMTIYNGGERFIDPPHPYFFTHGPTRYAGEMNQTFTNCIIVNNTRAHPSQPQWAGVAIGCTLADLKAEPPHIVPWETTQLAVELWYNYTGTASAVPHKLGLKFHASDGSAWQYPKAETENAGYARYLLGVTEAMSDSPYATQTDWRFGVFPVLNDVRDYGGEFSGNVHIHATAIKEGDSAGRGMGN